MEEQLPSQKKSFFRRESLYLVVVLIAAIIVGVLVIFRLNTTSTTTQSADYVENLPKDQVTVGVLGTISGLYPTVPFDVDSTSINSNMFEGLTQIRNGRLEPALAESWTNPDNLTWRIKLRSDAKFHNGEALEASDVKYTIEEAKKHEDWRDGVLNSIAARIDRVEVVDEATVQLQTKTPDATLLYWLVFLFILSEDQIKKDGLDKAVGTGPYKLVSINEKQITLQANNDYWAGAPKVKKLVYKTFEDDEALAGGLESGEVDLALLFVTTHNSRLEKKGFRIVSVRSGDITFFGFDINSKKAAHVNTETNPFASLDVRKAILLAIDINKALEATNVEGKPVSQFAVPELIGYNRSLKRPVTNITEAKNLLVKAGFPDGFKVTLDIDEPSKRLGEEVKKQLAQINIEVELNTYTDFQSYFERLTTDSSFFALAYAPDTLDSVDLLESFFHTDGFNNLKGFSDKDIDSLLEKALSTFNTAERAKLTQEIHKAVMEKLPSIPFYTRVDHYVIKDDVAFKPAPPFSFLSGYEISGRQKATEVSQ
ncbi:MAG: ABC transporter substrate-binding protein [Candidatus Woykebacteria bacterium]